MELAGAYEGILSERRVKSSLEHCDRPRHQHFVRRYYAREADLNEAASRRTHARALGWR